MTPPIPTYDFAPEDDLSLPVRCELLEVRNDYDASEPHRHNYYEVFYFTKGGGTHLIDFVAHEVADGSGHLVRPGQVHLLQRAPESHGVVVHFLKETLAGLPAFNRVEQSEAPVSTHAPGAFAGISGVVAMLRQELDSDAPAMDVALACMNLLLLKSMAGNRTGDAREGNGATGLFPRFRRLAEEHYRQGKLPAWYAGQLHLTERRLNQLCKDASGATVSTYLKDRLMLEAKRLLSHSEASVKEIGYHLGFDDPAYFTRFFRKNGGCTAGEFRAQYK